MKQYRCPDERRTPDDVVGCGKVFEGEPDEEGMVDCPECGIWFRPPEEEPDKWAWEEKPGMLKFRVLEPLSCIPGQRPALAQSVARPHVWAVDLSSALRAVHIVMGGGYSVAEPVTPLGQRTGLTLHQKRIRLAVDQGYRWAQFTNPLVSRFELRKELPVVGHSFYRWCVPDREPQDSVVLTEVPNYFGSLNAMSFLRSTLKPEERPHFVKELINIVEARSTDGDNVSSAVFELVDSSAEEQAEAYGRTRKLWDA